MRKFYEEYKDKQAMESITETEEDLKQEVERLKKEIEELKSKKEEGKEEKKEEYFIKRGALWHPPILLSPVG